MKIGLDLHGVIDAKPEFFAVFTAAMIASGHQIHVITGPSVTGELQKQLENLGIQWTHLISVVDILKNQESKGLLSKPMWQDEHGGWWADPYDWDRVKGDYCKRENIDLHFDDSDHYGYFFTTPYTRFFSKDTHRVQKTKRPCPTG